MRWLKLRAQGLDFASNNKTMVDQPAVTTKLQNVYETRIIRRLSRIKRWSRARRSR